MGLLLIEQKYNTPGSLIVISFNLNKSNVDAPLSFKIVDFHDYYIADKDLITFLITL